MMLVDGNRKAELPEGREVSVHLYVSVPTPPGLVEALPFNVTWLPIAAVWSGPALPTGPPPPLAWKVHCNWAGSSDAPLVKIIVKVSLLVTWPWAGTLEKLRVSCP